MFIKRNIEDLIKEYSNEFACLTIYGARQVGKSTVLDMIFGDSYRKVTLDDIRDRNLAKSNPKLFLETYGWPLIIDEIQKAPELLSEIKIFVKIVSHFGNIINRIGQNTQKKANYIKIK